MVDVSGCVGRGDTHISHGETVHLHVVGLALVGESAACPAIPYAGSHRAAAQLDYCIGGVRGAGHAHEETQRGNRRQHAHGSNFHTAITSSSFAVFTAGRNWDSAIAIPTARLADEALLDLVPSHAASRKMLTLATIPWEPKRVSGTRPLSARASPAISAARRPVVARCHPNAAPPLDSRTVRR